MINDKNNYRVRRGSFAIEIDRSNEKRKDCKPIHNGLETLDFSKVIAA